MSQKSKKIALLIIIIIALMLMIIIIGAHYSNKSSDTNTATLSVSSDFTTEVNKYLPKKEQVTDEDLKAKSPIEIKYYEDIISENTGYDMDYNDKYCNINSKEYISYINRDKVPELSCFYGNDENSVYFMENFDELKSSKDFLEDYYSLEPEEARILAAEQLTNIDNVYFKIMFYLSLSPKSQALYVLDNSLLGSYTLVSIDNVESYTKEDETETIKFEDGLIEKGLVTYTISIPHLLSGEEEMSGVSDEPYIEQWSINYYYYNNNEIYFRNNKPINGESHIDADKEFWIDEIQREDEQQ